MRSTSLTLALVVAVVCTGLGTANASPSTVKKQDLTINARTLGTTAVIPDPDKAPTLALELRSADRLQLSLTEDTLASTQARTTATRPQRFTPAAVSATGNAVVDAALSRQGAPYVWGASGPDAFDCSGLVQWAHAQAGITTPRVSQAQIAGGTAVSLDAIQPGDVVGYYSGITHVGIYIGGGKIVHASTYGQPVAIADLHHAPITGVARYYG